jgi:hypothetical protein
LGSTGSNLTQLAMLNSMYSNSASNPYSSAGLAANPIPTTPDSMYDSVNG